MIADEFCTLCEKAFGRKPKDVVEVKMLGPERRVHGACWEGLTDRKPLGDGREEEILTAIFEHEDERGLVKWLMGRPDLSGPLSRYTHLIRSPVDPERPLNLRWEGMTVAATESSWMEAIVELLLDGKPRTFNAICVEIADINGNAGFEKAPDKALRTLVNWRAVQWSSRTPIRFRINPTPPLLQVGETYSMVKGGEPVTVLAVGGEAGAYWYTVAPVSFKPSTKRSPPIGYDKYEDALVPLLELVG